MTTNFPSDEANSQVWREIESNLSRNPFGSDFNTAHETCSRYANDHHRLALVVRHEDGSAEKWTYHELDRQAAKAARVFANAGLRPGDRVAGLLSRQVESWITAVAAWRSGLVYVPLFGGFAADAIALRVRDSRAAAIVVAEEYLPHLTQAQSAHNLNLRVFVAGRTTLKLDNGSKSFWSELDSVDTNGPLVQTTLNDTATLLFTSGTSGNPKACAMTHAALLSVLPYAKSVLGLSPGSVLFATSDPAWAFGLYSTGTAAMALGIPRIMYSGPFVPETWRRVAQEEGATVLTTAPAALRRLSAAFAEHGVPTTLRTVAAAGEPLTDAVAKAWSETGAPPVRNGYGLSEVGMVLGDTFGSEALARPGMMTSAIRGFETFLADRDGQPVPSGESGLIAIRRPRHQMTSGYENVPELWEQRWKGDVFLTEDRASTDDAGRWRIDGRADDMIIASGHNISPVEVENALLQHPLVADAAAVSHPDPQRGDVIRAVIVLREEAKDDDALAQQLKDIVSSRVGRYAAPRLIDFVRELPRNEVGKLRRAALRDKN